MADTIYSAEYYTFISSASFAAARRILPIVYDEIRPGSVVDFGCGSGAWLKVWRELGVGHVVGVDGDYVTPESLFIDQAEFRAGDVSQPIDLVEQFDLAASLEVAEHLPRDCSPSLVGSLVKHAKVVLFSAATPGQGGLGHINERTMEFWREQFARHGYAAVDLVRPKVHADNRINAWYRWNIMLYVHRDLLDDLSAHVRAAIVAEGETLTDYTTPAFRLRKAILQSAPPSIVDLLHHVKRRLVALKLRMAVRETNPEPQP